MRSRKILPFVLFLLIALSCQTPARLLSAPSPSPTIFARRVPTRTPAPETSRTPAPGITPGLASPTAAAATVAAPARPTAAACAASPITAGLIQQTSPEQWLDWIEKLSGAEPVTIGGEQARITTRYTPAMFSGNPNARAFEFVHETLLGWYPAQQVEAQDFNIQDRQGQEFTWKNLILTLPGKTRAEETVIFSAHLDSITYKNPEQLAPGAEDNGSGSAALLEAARLLRGYTFERTIQIVWFTGEEQGLFGSRAFAQHIPHPEWVVGVVNLDMFGYDADNDRCFEIHAGTLPQSAAVGQCFVSALAAYDLGANQLDYLTTDAIRASDHASFWDAGIGAIEVVEDVDRQGQPGGCPASDPSPYYHTEEDTPDKINPLSGMIIVRAGLAAVANLAGPLEAP
jgi:hypothetical protein